MKLVFIHGAPATGKLTVAKALLDSIPGRLLDNHAAIAAAAGQNAPLIAMTFCYSHPHDLQYFEQFESLMRETKGELLPVYLHCSDEEVARRIGAADRMERRKISSMEALNRFRTTYNDAPVPSANCLCLDTGTASAQATAREIVRRLHLDTAETRS